VEPIKLSILAPILIIIHTNAQTFKDAENIPDRLMGQALDDIVTEVLQKTGGDVHLERPAKKNSGTTGKG
jgi:hypothetical protein